MTISETLVLGSSIFSKNTHINPMKILLKTTPLSSCGTVSLRKKVSSVTTMIIEWGKVWKVKRILNSRMSVVTPIWLIEIPTKPRTRKNRNLSSLFRTIRKTKINTNHSKKSHKDKVYLRKITKHKNPKSSNKLLHKLLKVPINIHKYLKAPSSKQINDNQPQINS